jgi:hypothetical protein
MSKDHSAIFNPSTQKSVQRAWALFDQFSSQHLGQQLHKNQLPISPNIMLLYISYLNQNKFAPATAVSYVSAIGYTHKIAALNDPISYTIVQKALAALTKLKPSGDTRLPIPLVILHRLLEAVDKTCCSQYNKLLLKSMYTTAFFGLMRVGEMTSKSGDIPALSYLSLPVASY